eukprot:9947683-Alexandrium_andersonii.AAC.1
MQFGIQSVVSIPRNCTILIFRDICGLKGEPTSVPPGFGFGATSRWGSLVLCHGRPHRARRALHGSALAPPWPRLGTAARPRPRSSDAA